MERRGGINAMGGRKYARADGEVNACQAYSCVSCELERLGFEWGVDQSRESNTNLIEGV
jgi:hypothetical protein